MTDSSPSGNGFGRKRQVLVAGALGAVGSLVAELVERHPDLELAALTARDTGDSTSPIGKKLYEIYAEHRVDVVIQELERLDLAAFDAAIVAYPAGPASKLAKQLLNAGLTVIDSCAAFRFEDVRTYEKWYGPHEEPALNKDAVYGLPELNRDQIAGAKLVGSPGCYPTASVDRKSVV